MPDSGPFDMAFPRLHSEATGLAFSIVELYLQNVPQDTVLASNVNGCDCDGVLACAREPRHVFGGCGAEYVCAYCALAVANLFGVVWLRGYLAPGLALGGTIVSRAVGGLRVSAVHVRLRACLLRGAARARRLDGRAQHARRRSQHVSRTPPRSARPRALEARVATRDQGALRENYQLTKRTTPKEHTSPVG